MRSWIETLGKISKELGVCKHITNVRVNDLEWSVYNYLNTYKLYIKDVDIYDKTKNSTDIIIYQDEFDYLNDILQTKQKDYQNETISKIESLGYACN
jgi:hypothetical protein